MKAGDVTGVIFRVCNALALMQCVASHPETRSTFLLAHIPLYLYPFLHTVSKTRPFEYLRLTSLGVIGALVKTDEQVKTNSEVATIDEQGTFFSNLSDTRKTEAWGRMTGDTVLDSLCNL